MKNAPPNSLGMDFPHRDLCVLIPVWKDYQWLVPFTLANLEKFWPAHPPIFLVGLTTGEARGAPHFPISDPTRRDNWCWMVRDGVRQAAGRYRKAYLIAEEHAPLARCHELHLNHTLPRAMDEWGAAYISLMGWDNRRFACRNPRLGPHRHHMMHLSRRRAPRFHLHPALWRLDVLEECCSVSLRDKRGKGSAWHFEKTCEKFDADLFEEWKNGCYQIAAFALTGNASRRRTLAALAERWIFNRLMALIPWMPGRELAEKYAWLLAVDDVYCDGPYPMIFSGLLRKGRLNEYLVRRLRRSAEGVLALTAIGEIWSTRLETQWKPASPDPEPLRCE